MVLMVAQQQTAQVLLQQLQQQVLHWISLFLEAAEAAAKEDKTELIMAVKAAHLE
jgi:hypothetical protein